MAKPPAVGPASLEHTRPHEFGDDVVDVFGVVSDHRAQQGEVTTATDDSGRLSHPHNIGVGVLLQRGEQRLIERLGYQCLGYTRLGSGGVKFADDVFNVERHPVTSAAYRGP